MVRVSGRALGAVIGNAVRAAAGARVDVRGAAQRKKGTHEGGTRENSRSSSRGRGSRIFDPVAKRSVVALVPVQICLLSSLTFITCGHHVVGMKTKLDTAIVATLAATLAINAGWATYKVQEQPDLPDILPLASAASNTSNTFSIGTATKAVYSTMDGSEISVAKEPQSQVSGQLFKEPKPPTT